MKIKKMLLPLLIGIAMLIVFPATSKAATDTIPFDVTVMEDYTYAQEVVKIVNKERTTAKLPELKMDEDLLEAAMIRANEIVLDYGCDKNTGRNHERPDGSKCFTVSNKVYGENIAAGYTTPKTVMEGWMNSEGHRANILKEGFSSIGVGVAKYGNTYFWVQVFGYGNATEIVKMPSNRTVTRTIDMLKQNIKLIYNSTTTLYKESLKNGKFEPVIAVNNPGWQIKCTEVPLNRFTYTSSDDSILKVDSKGIMTCVRPGTVTVKIAFKEDSSIFLEQEITIIGDISKLKVENISEQGYTGKAKKPDVIIKDGEYTLVKDKDYKLEYSSNINYGKAKVKIIGKGNYMSECEKTFEIVPSKVTGVKLVSTTSNTITVKWKKVENVSGYKVYVYNESKKSYEYYGKTTSTSMTIKKLNANTKYKIKVTAYKDKYSGIRSSALKTITSPKKVTNITVKSKDKNNIKLSWKKVSGVTGYKIYLYNSKTKKYEYYGKTKSTSMTVKNLKANTKYKIRVRAYKTYDGVQHLSDNSSAVSATTKKAVAASVYRTPTGKRYHLDPDCGGKNSYKVTLNKAKAAGLTPCKKCAN